MPHNHTGVAAPEATAASPWTRRNVLTWMMISTAIIATCLGVPASIYALGIVGPIETYEVPVGYQGRVRIQYDAADCRTPPRHVWEPPFWPRRYFPIEVIDNDAWGCTPEEAPVGINLRSCVTVNGTRRETVPLWDGDADADTLMCRPVSWNAADEVFCLLIITPDAYRNSRRYPHIKAC